jgi:hypothetical protein
MADNTTQISQSASREHGAFPRREDAYNMLPRISRRSDSSALQKRLNMENDRLRQQCSELESKASNLQKILTRYGRREEKMMDDDIAREFLKLKGGIFQFVRNHLRNTRDLHVPPASSSDFAQLRLQQIVAACLHRRFFSRDVTMFGHPDDQTEFVFQEFERMAMARGCDGVSMPEIIAIAHSGADAEVSIAIEAKEWRVSTVRMAERLGDNDAKIQRIKVFSRDIWDENLKQFSSQNRAEETRALSELERVCEIAYNLALKFGVSKIEYQWEQDKLPSAVTAPDEQEAEIVGLEAPGLEREGNTRVAFTVFGSVVRGDKSTGFLSDKRHMLLPPSVVLGPG